MASSKYDIIVANWDFEEFEEEFVVVDNNNHQKVE